MDHESLGGYLHVSGKTKDERRVTFSYTKVCFDLHPQDPYLNLTLEVKHIFLSLRAYGYEGSSTE